MKFSQSIAALSAVAGLATAAPLTEKRAAAITDGMPSTCDIHCRRTLLTQPDILNYALTLEHLEDKFYREGLANFTEAQFAAAGYDATFYANLKEVSSDESTHVKLLTTALTGKSMINPVYKLPANSQ
jgi:hypothetical protein